MKRWKLDEFEFNKWMCKHEHVVNKICWAWHFLMALAVFGIGYELLPSVVAGLIALCYFGWCMWISMALSASPYILFLQLFIEPDAACDITNGKG